MCKIDDWIVTHIEQGTLLGTLWWPKCEGNKKRGDIYTHKADSLCYRVETNTVVWSKLHLK